MKASRPVIRAGIGNLARTILPGGDHVEENFVAPAVGLGETLLLQPDHPQNEIAVFRKLPVHRLKVGDNLAGNVSEKRRGQPQLAPVADAPADDPAQHVAPAFVARHHAVADQERRGAGMFRHHPHGEVGFRVLAVSPAGQLRDPGDDGLEQVGLVDVVLVLQDDRRPFQPHARVDAWGGQGRAVPLRVLVELHENQVPKLHETLAVAVGVATGDWPGRRAVPFLPKLGSKNAYRHHRAAALLLAAVVVDFGTGAGGSLGPGGAPPVVFIAVAIDAVFGYSHPVAPNAVGLVVVQVDGHEQPVRVQPKLLGNQLPSKIHRAFFEIVADAEISQHFEEGQVLVIAHFVDVGGPETLLAAGQAT